jgi:hypothetical protein
MKTKIEVLVAVAAMACASVVLSAEDAPYPKEKLAAFVVEKLDVTSLPTVYRPKKQKGKRTLTDYGYTVQKLEETEALVKEAGGTRRLAIKILQEGSAGIYACMAEPVRDGGDPKAQSVILLKRKDSSELLKGRETFREFKSCPAIDASADNSSAYGGGGD